MDRLKRTHAHRAPAACIDVPVLTQAVKLGKAWHSHHPATPCMRLNAAACHTACWSPAAIAIAPLPMWVPWLDERLAGHWVPRPATHTGVTLVITCCGPPRSLECHPHRYITPIHGCQGSASLCAEWGSPDRTCNMPRARRTARRMLVAQPARASKPASCPARTHSPPVVTARGRMPRGA